MKLLLATRNRHKVAEMRRLLDSGWDVIPLDDVPGVPVVEENGGTFEENARLKARAAAAVFRTWTLAEDSGLEVEALGGEPGVRSARYCGPDATDRERIRYLLDRLVAVPLERRRARFRCVACVIDPAGDEHVFEGACEGHIAPHARGSAGFGYDPVFIPDGHSRTFGELGPVVKDGISHRSRAMDQVAAFLKARAGGAAPGS
ncbi:RdgB/HAM1 family non-canonical purine NTP pyrophosphatase [candidate division WOR-3 bacterium]|nr:RdgB/HAM1 family non-canonical purine NTP pyrophosphatase [candidate division WOR-3 bacterium]